jgi:hypothetical protein
VLDYIYIHVYNYTCDCHLFTLLLCTSLFCYHSTVGFVFLSLSLLAQRYSSGVFVLLLQLCRSYLSVAWQQQQQHSWGLLSVCYVPAAFLVSPVFFFKHSIIPDTPSVSLDTEEFFQVTCLTIYFMEA